MSNGCSPIEFMDGGTLTNVHIFNSEFTNGVITNSDLSNVNLINNITMDDAVAQAMADRLCVYIKNCLATATTATPEVTTGGDIPTTIIGRSRDVVLGLPVVWIDLGDHLVPAYAKK